jgi:hypothetical protein
LSEDTDAAVVVVSEERGGISLCFHGNIVRNLDAASLRTALLGLLTHKPKRRTTIPAPDGRMSRPSSELDVSPSEEASTTTTASSPEDPKAPTPPEDVNCWSPALLRAAPSCAR